MGDPVVIDLSAVKPATGIHGRTVKDALINPAQASPICLLAGQGASPKADWPSVEAAQRRAASKQIGPNLLILNDGVMPERSPDWRARLIQAASLHGTTHPNL